MPTTASGVISVTLKNSNHKTYMDNRDNHNNSLQASEEEIYADSSIHTDEESARIDLAGLFSNRFSNISLLYSSSYGATEIHTATRYGKRFALKGLKQDYSDDPIHNMCMAKEFEIGITLDHPNIRRTLGFENIDGLGKCIVFEYIDGVTLSEMLAEGMIDSAKASSIAMQIANAMKYLHSKQIFHRDLKPDNIMISHQGGVVKLIDFNLSDRDDYVVLKYPAGSKRYMAPEQSNPEATPTAESDIYSLGVIMKELADASGNRTLARAAAACTDREPSKRRKGLDMIDGYGSDAARISSRTDQFLESASLTYILSFISLVLSAFITVHYFNF